MVLMDSYSLIIPGVPRTVQINLKTCLSESYSHDTIRLKQKVQNSLEVRIES